MDSVLVLGAIAAVIATVAVSALRRAGLSWPRRSAAARSPMTHRRGMAIRRASAGVLCAVALAIAVTEVAHQQQKVSQLPDSASLQGNALQVSPHADDVQVTAHTRAMQVDAWSDLGGQELMDRFGRDRGQLLKIVRKAVEEKQELAYLLRIRPICNDIGQIAPEADEYFRVPDPGTQVFWQKFITQARESGQYCNRALNQLNSGLSEESSENFRKSFQKLAEAENTRKWVDISISMVHYTAKFFPRSTCGPRETIRCA